MPLTTYIAGEILTASSLNDNFTFAAANPPAAASGLAFISSTAFTTATSISVPNNTFTSTFTNYRIVLNLTALTTDADFTMRLRAAGSDDTAENYSSMYLGTTSTAATSNQNGASLTAFLAAESDAGNVNYSLIMDIYGPKLTYRTAFTGSIVFTPKAGSPRTMRTGGGSYTTDTSFDALTFISSVASSMTGQINVYGYANS